MNQNTASYYTPKSLSEPTSAERTGQIVSEMSALENGVQELRAMLEGLERKLGPLINAVPVDQRTDVKEAPLPVIAPLANQVRQHVREIGEISNRIRQLETWVEL